MAWKCFKLMFRNVFGRFFTGQHDSNCFKMTTNVIYNHTDLLIDGIFSLTSRRWINLEMTLCFYCLQIAGVCVWTLHCQRIWEFCAESQSETETGSPKHVFFITVTTRLQSRDIQVTDSDTNLYTGFYSDTFRDGSCPRGSTLQKSVFNGQSGYIVGVYWFLLHPCTCVILDGTTGNRIVPPQPLKHCHKECFWQCILTHKYLYIYFDFS